MSQCLCLCHQTVVKTLLLMNFSEATRKPLKMAAKPHERTLALITASCYCSPHRLPADLPKRSSLERCCKLCKQNWLVTTSSSSSHKCFRTQAAAETRVSLRRRVPSSLTATCQDTLQVCGRQELWIQQTWLKVLLLTQRKSYFTSSNLKPVGGVEYPSGLTPWWGLESHDMDSLLPLFQYTFISH